MRSFVRRHQLVLFFALTFIISWIPWYTGGHGFFTWGVLRRRPDRGRFGARKHGIAGRWCAGLDAGARASAYGQWHCLPPLP